MNCDECRDAMLEADPELLTGIGDAPVAVHIQTCERCRDLAAAMLGQLTLARNAYARIESGSPPPRHSVRFIPRRAVWAVATLAAAAVVITIIGGRRVAPAPEAPSDTASTSVAVVVPDGRNAIVFATKNPLISVVWIY